MGRGCAKGGDSVITTSADSVCIAVDGPATGSAIELVGALDDVRKDKFDRLASRVHMAKLSVKWHSGPATSRPFKITVWQPRGEKNANIIKIGYE